MKRLYLMALVLMGLITMMTPQLYADSLNVAINSASSATWADAGNGAGCDDSRATYASASGSPTEVLHCVVGSVGLPAGCTIDSINVHVQGSQADASSVGVQFCSYDDETSTLGDANSKAFSGSEADNNYLGYGLWGYGSWSVAQFNAEGYGLNILPENSFDYSTDNLSVDCGSVTIWYTEGASGSVSKKKKTLLLGD